MDVQLIVFRKSVTCDEVNDNIMCKILNRHWQPTEDYLATQEGWNTVTHTKNFKFLMKLDYISHINKVKPRNLKMGVCVCPVLYVPSV